MKCLKPSEMYLFLEGELSGKRQAEFKSHLKTCPKCRQSLEQRKVMLQAVKKIPSYQAPPGFSKQVMTHIKPIRSSVTEWIQGIGAAVVFLSVLSLMFSALTKQGLPELLTAFFQSIANSVQEILVISVKFIKALAVFADLLFQFIGLALKNILALFPTATPEIQILILVFGLLAAFMILINIKQKFILGDKR